ncbi:hypothetical protein SAMD00019534_044530 [Acytostelium subglobosum LB1]|uniref:hypothetical protein n=1 Tax=Acytostelium subglobosum LB1 TaxID=1410327 RepID=UPI00064520AF|nr:hypothetical protein SAMD00019534_044530 [Acytostelium subglobosum LB1]GAM21278.1 hypothetical protein SAMD00019534_044530 [Acytostelium subglobosum LB1]|eukprot:XP_012755397.1 hypothetical protein SAMD00019534_044530 [Acytostelium subglobosum LB1]
MSTTASAAVKIMDFPLKGEFMRKVSSFRNAIAKGGPFPPEANRYHLYVSLACPWAHRTIIVRKLKGLEHAIGLSVVDYFLGGEGWHFSERQGATLDPINNYTHLKQLYYKANPQFEGRFTVPVLWDKQTSTIVNNESSEIIRMLNSEFNDVAKNPSLDLAPKELLAEIDEINTFVYDNVNNGVYKCGFAGDQEAYNVAFEKLFSALEKLEERLSKSRWLVGKQMTEADIRLFTTLVRFDPVYFGHFKTNKRMIKDYPALSNYLREIYQNEQIKSTVDFHHIKHHYYESHRSINPTGIVPEGPEMDYLNLPHNRASLN